MGDAEKLEEAKVEIARCPTCGRENEFNGNLVPNGARYGLRCSNPDCMKMLEVERGAHGGDVVVRELLE